MAVPYERYEDEIEDTGDQQSLSSEEGPVPPSIPRAPGSHKLRYQEVFHDRWPFQMGVAQILLGMTIAALGIVNVIILPLVLNQDAEELSRISFTQKNLWGLGLWAGLILVITGSLGLSAAVHKSVSRVYAFFGFILLDIMIFFAFIVLILCGYSHGWTIPAAYKDQSYFYTHLSVCVLISLGSLLLVISFTQYFEDVFFGELQCVRRALHCCLPCWCPRVVEPEELMDEQSRPPSLPI